MSAKKRANLRQKLLRFLLVTVGSVIYAAGIELFLDPNRIAPGGVAGIAVILTHYWNIDTGLLIFAMNLPLFLIGGIRFKGRFLGYTVYSVALSSAVIDLLAARCGQFVPLTHDLLLAGITGGALMAAGMALVFSGGGATGGSDIVVKLLRQRFPHVKSGDLFLCSDLVIAAVSSLVFNDLEVGLYAAVMLFVNSYVLDLLLYGSSEAKLIYIVSSETQAVSARLMEELGVGVTLLHGEGAYTEEHRKVILTAFRKQLYPRVRAIVKEEDAAAFMIVASATEVFGEGFKDHFADEL